MIATATTIEASEPQNKRNEELPLAAAVYLGGVIVAALAFVLVNHAALAEMLRLARGHSYRESGLFTLQNVATDLVLAALGVTMALVWMVGPILIGFALAPLLLIHRSLAVPRLEEE